MATDALQILKDKLLYREVIASSNGGRRLANSLMLVFMIPAYGMEAPAIAEYGTTVKWRLNPAKPTD